MRTHADPSRVDFIVVVTTLIGAAVAALAYGDCGSIPFTSPLDAGGTLMLDLLSPDGPDVKVDPLNVVVYEPGQRAIVLWNGEEEILLLSTEIRTSKPVSILEVIPLPSEPTVELGDFALFEGMQRLLVEKTMWKVASGGGVPGVEAPPEAAQITFHEKMGAHDLAVVEVLNGDQFVSWVFGFLAQKGATKADVPDDFIRVVENYLGRGFTWFVFDVIQAGDEVRSRQPIQYRFKSEALYYPLEISSLEKGKTAIELLLVTQSKLTSYPVVEASMKGNPHFTASFEDLYAVSPEWADMMAAPELTLQQFSIRGKLHKMRSDFVAR